MDHYTQLPLEIVSLIATHLGPQDYYNCTLVNKLFYTVTNPLLWRTIEIKDRPKALQFLDSVIEAKNPVGIHVRHLNLYYIKWRNSLFLRMVKHLSGLKQLNIPDCKGLTDISLQQLSVYCPNINTLSLGRYNITQRCMDILLQQYTQLRILELDSCISQSLDSISGLTPCSLEKLAIVTNRFPVNEENRNMDDEEETVDSQQEQVMEANTVVDLACFPLLTHLDLFGGTFDMNNVSLFTLPSTTTTIHCPLLESLHTFADFRMEPNQLLYFIKTHPKLKQLCIDEGPCNDTILDAISIYCPEITELSLYQNPSVTSRGVRRFIQNSPTLWLLDLTYCGIQAHEFPELFPFFTDRTGNLGMLNYWAIDTIRNKIKEQ